MTPREFFELVSRMRAVQQAYGKNRSAALLSSSKRLEKAVDAEIERVKKVLEERNNLFGNE